MFRRKQKEMSQHFCWPICCLYGCELNITDISPASWFLSNLYGRELTGHLYTTPIQFLSGLYGRERFP